MDHTNCFNTRNPLGIALTDTAGSIYVGFECEKVAFQSRLLTKTAFFFKIIISHYNQTLKCITCSIFICFVEKNCKEKLWFHFFYSNFSDFTCFHALENRFYWGSHVITSIKSNVLVSCLWNSIQINIQTSLLINKWKISNCSDLVLTISNVSICLYCVFVAVNEKFTHQKIWFSVKTNTGILLNWLFSVIL